MFFCRVLAQFAAAQVLRFFFAGKPVFQFFQQIHAIVLVVVLVLVIERNKRGGVLCVIKKVRVEPVSAARSCADGWGTDRGRQSPPDVAPCHTLCARQIRIWAIAGRIRASAGRASPWPARSRRRWNNSARHPAQSPFAAPAWS